LLDANKSIKVDGLEKSIIDKCKQRIIAIGVIFFVSFITVNIKLIDISKPLKIKEDTIKDFKKSTKRGNILDRNGSLLAVSMPTWSLYKDKNIIYDIEVTKNKILQIIPNLNKTELKKDLESKKPFSYIAKHLQPGIAKEINQLGQPALKFKKEYLRVYPHSNEISHILGFTGKGVNGLAGIEFKYNNVLNTGQDIHLTIDARVQYKIFKILTEGIELYKYKGAVGIIIDVNTGEIIAGISIPSFNPNPYYSDEATTNQISASNFELGSVFKAIVIASALNDNIVTLESKLDATEPLKIGKRFIKDYHAKNSILNLEEVFIYSSNIGAAKIALELGKERQSYYFEKLGLKTKIESGIQETEYPVFLSLNKVTDIHVATMSYGYGISVSPLNMISALATTVNGGHYIQPSVVKDTNLLDRPRVKVFSKEVSEIMKVLYKSNVDNGTAKNIKPIPYLVGGKTGTANKVVNGKYASKKVVSSLISFFPINNPRYALFVLLDEPKATGNIWGRTPGFNAVPLSKNIIIEIAPLLGVKSIHNEEL
jgi:cell division protein FtsI (penicillin-binding protein 3)